MSTTPYTETGTSLVNEKIIKSLKGIFSVISLIVFLFSLLGSDHDVRGFYCSLLIHSSSQLIDLIVYSSNIGVASGVPKRTKTYARLASIFSSACFILSCILLIFDRDAFSYIQAYLSGAWWYLTFILFPLIIYSSAVNVLRPIGKIENNYSIPIEDRE